jgi:hypothetical protein
VKHLGSVVHAALVAAAGVVCLSGFLVAGTANVLASEPGCQTGAVCHDHGTMGKCNYDVDNKVCCCELSSSCPEHTACMAVIE